VTVPSDRCGYTWDPEWLDRPNHQHCCLREPWDGGDRCWWHSGGDRSVAELRAAATERDCPVEAVPGARRETAANRRLNARRAGGDPDGVPHPAELLCGARLSTLELADADFRGVWFNGADLSGANLRGADLSGADMERVDLADAVLRETDLSGADVRGDVSGADLRGANLSGASVCVAEKVFASLPRPDLSGAHLGGADLSDADLSGANLADARLGEADLSGANLEMATLQRANLFGADLVDARLYGAVLSEAQVNRGTHFFGDEERCVYHPPDGGGLWRRLRRALPGGADPSRGGDPTPAADGAGSTPSAGDRATPPDGDLADARADHAPPPDDEDDHAPDAGDDLADDEDEADRYAKAAWTYRAIEGLARQNSFPSLQSRMFLERQRMQTRMHRRTGGIANPTYLFSVVSGLLIDHGEGYLRVLGWGGVIVATFALLFPVGGWIRPVGAGGDLAAPITWARIAEDPLLLWESVYYSTLTFTNLGFGDFRPVGTVGQALTVAETASGAVLLALLVFVLGRRASR
jgi:uncharacterized protein YjbI with pentapeptide repeats